MFQVMGMGEPVIHGCPKVVGGFNLQRIEPFFSNTVVHRSNDPFWGLVICCYSIDMCI